MYAYTESNPPTLSTDINLLSRGLINFLNACGSHNITKQTQEEIFKPHAYETLPETVIVHKQVYWLENPGIRHHKVHWVNWICAQSPHLFHLRATMILTEAPIQQPPTYENLALIPEWLLVFQLECFGSAVYSSFTSPGVPCLNPCTHISYFYFFIQMINSLTY